MLDAHTFWAMKIQCYLFRLTYILVNFPKNVLEKLLKIHRKAVKLSMFEFIKKN